MKKNHTLFQNWPIWCHTVTCSTKILSQKQLKFFVIRLYTDRNDHLQSSRISSFQIRIEKLFPFNFASSQKIKVVHIYNSIRSVYSPASWFSLEVPSGKILLVFYQSFNPTVSKFENFNSNSQFFVYSYDSKFLVSQTVLSDYRNFQQI